MTPETPERVERPVPVRAQRALRGLREQEGSSGKERIEGRGVGLGGEEGHTYTNLAPDCWAGEDPVTPLPLS